jgi:ATP-dependent Clp protease ATP-binding subunit ClpA
MRLNLAIYIESEKQPQGIVYTGRTVSGLGPTVRDHQISAVTNRLREKLIPELDKWLRDNATSRVLDMLYQPEWNVTQHKLRLTLSKRTVQWRILLVQRKIGNVNYVFSPSLPRVWFDVQSGHLVEDRAVETYTRWCRQQLLDDPDADVDHPSIHGKAWLAPLAVDLTRVRSKKKPASFLESLLGSEKMEGSIELQKVGVCLDQLIGDFKPAIGREKHVEKLLAQLERVDRQSLLIVGEPSVGKTAIIRQTIAQRAASQNRKTSASKQTWLISPQRLISGMSYLGQWEQRWLSILKVAAKKNHTLYFEDVLGLLSAGISRDSKLCAADVLKSFLAETPVRILAEIEPNELALLRRRDRALADLFQIIRIRPMDETKTLAVLDQVANRIESESEIRFHPDLLPSIVSHQQSLAPGRSFPGKAISLLEDLARKGNRTIAGPTLIQHLESVTGLKSKILSSSNFSADELHQTISTQLIGQPPATDSLSKLVARAALRLAPEDRPLGVQLLLGPTGVGKTESVKVLTRLLYTNESHLIRIDMNEISSAYAAEQLIGTFNQPDGRLTTAVRRRPHSVVLFDEIEKAHPDVFDYLLQVLGEGRLTDARGRLVDFRNTFIVMTSNLGVREDSSTMGFEQSSSSRNAAYQKAAREFFRPEFINRIDEVVCFSPLDKQDIKRIAEIQLNQVLSRDGIENREVYANLTDEGLDWLVDRGFDRRLGARAIKRTLEQSLIQPLADHLAASKNQSPIIANIRLNTTEGQSPSIDCSAVPLAMTPREPTRLIDSPQAVVDIAREMTDRFSDQLRGLKSPDSEDTPAQRAAYYSMHDWIYDARDQLKICQDSLQERSYTTVTNQPDAIRPNSGYSPASRRRLKDYQAATDIKSAVGSATGVSDLRNEIDQLCRSLIACWNLLSNFDSPTTWIVSMVRLGNRIQATQETKNEAYWTDFVGSSEGFSKGYSNYFGHLNPGRTYLQCLLHVLTSRLHYDVSFPSERQPVAIVSGAAVGTYLNAITGTYRIQNLFHHTNLGFLVAKPCGPDALDELKDRDWEIPLETTDSLLASDRADFWTTIRGDLSGVALDLRTEQQVSMHAPVEQWENYLQGLLPVPEELKQHSTHGETR